MWQQTLPRRTILACSTYPIETSKTKPLIPKPPGLLEIGQPEEAAGLVHKGQRGNCAQSFRK
jgi:hypothetical protein